MTHDTLDSAYDKLQRRYYSKPTQPICVKMMFVVCEHFEIFFRSVRYGLPSIYVPCTLARVLVDGPFCLTVERNFEIIVPGAIVMTRPL